MQHRELDPGDLTHELGEGYDTMPLPEHLAEGIALGTVHALFEDHRNGTEGPVMLTKSEGLVHELHVRGPQGKVAAVPLGREGLEAPTRDQREADARFFVEMKNNAEWILRAALYGIKQGFVP